MSPIVLLSFLVGYFALLVGISWYTARRSSDNASFFIAGRNSKWYLVAFGMIGTCLSGVTFISVPGAVGTTGFGYFQFILGNAVGFVIIATVLLPMYYRINLVSIYTYLEKRFGYQSYRTGAMIFLVSRTISSAFRLYLVTIVLQKFIFDAWHIPFVLTIGICLLLIWLYTRKGGLKTIIITDTLQTFFLLVSVVLTVYYLSQSLGLDVQGVLETVKQSSYSQIFFWDDPAGNPGHFLKQFLGGIFVTIAMTGLDQDLMQKNLSMGTIREAQKNMLTFTPVFVLINLVFLLAGALLYTYAARHHMDPAALETPDHLFPEIALRHLGMLPGILFMLGLTAATFATTDSALTALTTSFCIDFLQFDKKKHEDQARLVSIRHAVHAGFSVLMLIVIVIFRIINDESVVTAIFKAAGYTYGPLLGLFALGIITRRAVTDKLVPYICILSPLLCYSLEKYLYAEWGYALGFELILLNGIITYLLLVITGKRGPCQKNLNRHEHRNSTAGNITQRTHPL